MSPSKIAIGLFSIVALGMILACGGAGTSSIESGVPRQILNAEAVVMVQDAVTAHLKFPDDADFERFPDVLASESPTGTPIAVVTGKLVAKNAFGAELTHRYKGTVAFENGVYRLAMLEIDGTAIQADAAFIDRESRKLDAAHAATEQARAADRQREIEASRHRTWTSNDGKFSTDAKFLKFENSKVHLEKPDGEIIQVSLTQLTKEDRAWVQAWQRNH